MGVSRLRDGARGATLPCMWGRRRSDLRALDDLARALAQPTSRRRALVLVAAAVVGTAARPRRAYADTEVPGDHTCNPNGTETCRCFPGPGIEVMKATCFNGQKCACKLDDQGKKKIDCDDRACPDGRHWCGSCKGRCCGPQETCTGGRCCSNSRACAGTCCPTGKQCAFFLVSQRLCCPTQSIMRVTLRGKPVRLCCPPGTIAVNPGDSGPGCCPAGDKGCCDDYVVPLLPKNMQKLQLHYRCFRGKTQIV